MKKAIVFQVSGRGQFPVDMLRYDQCWPRGPEDASRIAVHHTDSDYLGGRTLTMMSYNPPTVDRWRSFGWGCREI